MTVSSTKPHERPIPFSTEMVRAIRRDEKTQTRRVVNLERLRVRLPKTVRSDPGFFDPKLVATPKTYRAALNPHGAVSILVGEQHLGVKPGEFHFVCPYVSGPTHLADFGNGDKRWVVLPEGEQRLWARETWQERDGVFLYRADTVADGWRSGRFMPRRAARTWMVPISARLEHLHDITDDDIRAEGVTPKLIATMAPSPASLALSPRAAFAMGWDKLNGKRAPWAENGWVWRVEFSFASGGAS